MRVSKLPMTCSHGNTHTPVRTDEVGVTLTEESRDGDELRFVGTAQREHVQVALQALPQRCAQPEVKQRAALWAIDRFGLVCVDLALLISDAIQSKSIIDTMFS